MKFIVMKIIIIYYEKPTMVFFTVWSHRRISTYCAGLEWCGRPGLALPTIRCCISPNNESPAYPLLFSTRTGWPLEGQIWVAPLFQRGDASLGSYTSIFYRGYRCILRAFRGVTRWWDMCRKKKTPWVGKAQRA